MRLALAFLNTGELELWFVEPNTKLVEKEGIGNKGEGPSGCGTLT